MIPFKRLPIGEDEKRAACEVIDSGFLSRGTKTIEFEKAFAEYVGAKYAVGLKSCAMSILIALEAKGFGKYDVITIPSMTVPLVANMVIKLGATINFSDNVDWVGNEYEIKPCGIYDSAHQVNRDQAKLRQDDDIECFSFYPTKPITGIEGGMITTNNEEYANYIRTSSMYGRVGLDKVKNSWEYAIKFPGWKENMTDMQAAIAHCQLNKLDGFNKTRAEIRDYYNKAFGLDNKSLYLFRICVNNRDEFVKHMLDNGVECGVHFMPLHKMRAYDYCVFENRKLPKTDFVGEHTVSLPFHTFLEQKDLDYIIKLTGDWHVKNQFSSTDLQDGEISQVLHRQSIGAGLR